MDIGRSAADAVMFWDASQTVSSHVRWFIVDDSTPFLPFPHCFSREIWDMVHWFNDQAGEDAGSPQPWANGHAPGPFRPRPLDGSPPCGPPEWFLDGAPSDAPALSWQNGMPVCCKHAAIEASGCSCSKGYKPSGLIPVTCGGCTLAPATWLLSVAGIANAGCGNCPAADALDLPLVYIPAGMPDNAGEISNGCYWQSALLPAVCSARPFGGVQVFWELQFSYVDFNWHLYLRAGLTQLAHYSLSVAAFHCTSGNTFTGPTWIAGTCSGGAFADIAPG
jgi:hypothetical protein